MKVFVLAVFLIVAETAQAPGDRADWLAGNWHCDSRAGSRSNRTYSSVNNGASLNMRSTVRLPSGLFAFLRERYDYDAATITWTIDSPQSALWGPMHATAAPWLGREWTFTGTGSAPSAIGEMGPERPMRMIYTTIGDDSFHRQHQVRGDGTWQTYSEETCYRDSAPRPRPTGTPKDD